eukprot:g15653.t1
MEWTVRVQYESEVSIGPGCRRLHQELQRTEEEEDTAISVPESMVERLGNYGSTPLGHAVLPHAHGRNYREAVSYGPIVGGDVLLFSVGTTNLSELFDIREATSGSESESEAEEYDESEDDEYDDLERCPDDHAQEELQKLFLLKDRAHLSLRKKLAHQEQRASACHTNLVVFDSNQAAADFLKKMYANYFDQVFLGKDRSGGLEIKNILRGMKIFDTLEEAARWLMRAHENWKACGRGYLGQKSLSDLAAPWWKRWWKRRRNHDDDAYSGQKRTVEQQKYQRPLFYFSFLSAPEAGVYKAHISGTKTKASSAEVVSQTLSEVRGVLLDNFEQIREDYARIQTRTLVEDRNVRAVLRSGSWRKLPLLSYQHWHAEADWTFSQRLLRENETLQKNLAFGLGSCYFSRIAPGSTGTGGSVHIREHFGPTNGRIRIHLGLEVPRQSGLVVPRQSGLDDEQKTSDHCFLRVGDGCYPWREGEILPFDDSFLHAVYMKSEKMLKSVSEESEPEVAPARGGRCRGVLVLDIYHPELTEAERRFLEQIEQVKEHYLPNLQQWAEVSEVDRSGACGH